MLHLIESAAIAGFHVVLAGDGLAVAKLVQNFPNLDYRGKFGESDLSDLIQEISVMYAMYDDSRANIQLGAIPTKMLDAAAFGVPSVTNSDTPMGDFCLSERIGTVAPYGDTGKIAEAILDAYKMEVKTKKPAMTNKNSKMLLKDLWLSLATLSKFRPNSDTSGHHRLP